ncbi:Dynactin subunit 4like [Caligus rogercresseyi]|uniref:Dynactin subunit 4 n=1 Tax=Caligus rogercresseyi TaxID=217165 RepID=A0A7T8JXI4_CALRO|nr:Dynactin subunit 4like [Caligus rogercresseyi]
MSEAKAAPLPEMPVDIPCPFSEELLLKVRYTCTCGVSRLSYLILIIPGGLALLSQLLGEHAQNRCANCFDCPSCGHTLSTKATSDSTSNPNETPSKVYYLSCVFCRWSSRDIGLSNQKKENPYAGRMSSLLEHYRSIAQKEKLEKESKRQMGRKLNYLQLSDKYGLARKRAGLPPLSLGGGSDPDKSIPSLRPGNPLPIQEIESENSLLLEMEEANIYNRTDMRIRLSQTDTQPLHLDKIHPLHMQLVIKRSQRCRKCEHNLSKPEYNPTSIKFKIQLAAFYHVPDISIFSVKAPWKSGEPKEFILKVVNPTQHPTDIQFLDAEEMKVFRAEEQEKTSSAAASDKKNVMSSLLRQQSLVKASERHLLHETAQVILPKGKIHLPPRDDAAEFDESAPDLHKDDDKSVIAWRKGNKVGVRMSAIPDGSEESTEVLINFGLKFLYTNTISALDKKDVQTGDILIPVYVNLGNK